ncbi:MAG: hypothetical protein A2096_06495 [Spirochaetes bacterium GWF1_41_5]|nr:MAG: hypothetical protein A2096_06495 [Spirochaetes bacterium GWF1_41_5]HBE04401.1 hypothetical protein [Spirochaetia bacterium]
MKKILCILLITGLYAADQAKPPADDPLIVNSRLVQAKYDFIEKLLSIRRYREALDELLQLRTDLPRKMQEYTDYKIGTTYMAVGDYILSGFLVEDSYGVIKYRDELDVVYYTEEEKRVLRDKLKNSDAKNTQPASGSGADSGGALNAPAAGGGLTDTAPAAASPVTDLAPLEEKLGGSDKPVSGLQQKAAKYYQKAVDHFNYLISGKTTQRDYKELAVIKKAETFLKMGETVFADREYEFFMRYFTGSSRMVDVMMAKADVQVKMEKYFEAVRTLEDILETWPETDKKDLVNIKIDYIKLLNSKGRFVTDFEKKEDLENKMQVIQEFDNQVQEKQEKLDKIEQKLKNSTSETASAPPAAEKTPSDPKAESPSPAPKADNPPAAPKKENSGFDDLLE